MGSWAMEQSQALMENIPIVPSLWDYFEKQWGDKTHMWVGGHRSMPYVRQNINATVESYQTNLKALMKALATIFEQL